MGTCGYIGILERVIWNVELGIHRNKITNIISGGPIGGTSRKGMSPVCAMWSRVSKCTSQQVGVYECRLKCTSVS